MSDSYAIGVDVGGTKMAFALVNQHGKVLDTRLMPTQTAREPLAIITDMAAGINQLQDAAPLKPLGIGIGIPGQVYPDSGVIKNAYNLGWTEVRLKELLSPMLKQDMPIRVMKDADANICGEYYFGAAQGAENCMYIGVGSGLGGAIIANGRLMSGANGTAAGIGHMQLYPEGEVCACGLIGCAETVVSGPGLVKVYKKLVASAKAEVNDGEITSHSILDAVSKKEPLATQALSILAQGLGKVIAICVSIVNPQSIVLGGGIARAAFDLMLPETLLEVKSHALIHTYQDLKILPSTLISSALGPASLVWYSGI